MMNLSISNSTSTSSNNNTTRKKAVTIVVSYTISWLHLGLRLCSSTASMLPVELGQKSAPLLPSKLKMIKQHAGDCQNHGPFLGPYFNTGPNTGPNLGDPKRDHNFDNPPCRNMHLKTLVVVRPGLLSTP